MPYPEKNSACHWRSEALSAVKRALRDLLRKAGLPSVCTSCYKMCYILPNSSASMKIGLRSPRLLPGIFLLKSVFVKYVSVT